MGKVSTFAVASVMLAGCLSLEQIRSSDPTAAGTFQGQWREFAECVNYELNGRVLFDSQRLTARVGSTPNRLWLAPQADYELIVFQRDAETVEVELRQRPTLDKDWARDHYWSAVERCGADQTSASSR